MPTPQSFVKARRFVSRMAILSVIPSLALLLPQAASAQATTNIETPVQQSPGVTFNETNSIKPGTDVVVLHRNYYAGETDYRYTRGTFTSWGEHLDESHEVEARVQHIQDRHDVEHPLSMYRGSDMSQLKQSPGHYSDVKLKPMNSSTDRSISMDHVVAIVRADELPAQVMSNATGTAPPRTYGMPTGTTMGTAMRTGTGTNSGTSIGGASSSGTSSTGSTGTVRRGSPAVPSSTGGSSARSSSGRSSSGGSGCPVAPRNTTGSSGSYGRAVSRPTATAVRSTPRSSGSSGAGSISTTGSKKGSSGRGPK